MIWTILDYCRNCDHSVYCHIAPYSSEGNKFGDFKVLKWGMCDVYGNMGIRVCYCDTFIPKDNLKFLEWRYEQTTK